MSRRFVYEENVSDEVYSDDGHISEEEAIINNISGNKFSPDSDTSGSSQTPSRGSHSALSTLPPSGPAYFARENYSRDVQDKLISPNLDKKINLRTPHDCHERYRSQVDRESLDGSLETPPKDCYRSQINREQLDDSMRNCRKVLQRAGSFGSESLSTIRLGTEAVLEGVNVREIYDEMQQINDKMKREFKILHERGQLLKEKEFILEQREKSLTADKLEFSKLVENEVIRRILLREQEHKTEVEKMKMTMKEKNNEHRRLKENFDTLKGANDILRKELETMQKQHDKLERQSCSLQARLSNLQRHKDFASKKEEDFLPVELLKKKKESKEVKPVKHPLVKPPAGIYDVLGILLEWISEIHLRYTATDQPTKPLEGTSTAQFIQEKCIKVLPSLVEILRDLPTASHSLVLPCLQFVYWALTHMDSISQHQRSSLKSTLRRLGEELYKPRIVKFSDEDPGSESIKVAPPGFSLGKQEKLVKEGLFFRSPSLHVRLLSCLIILKTLNQVDHIAHVFEVLKADLKNESAKELFLYYQATSLLIPYLRPANKALMHSAVDLYLQLSMESSLLPAFLETCSSEIWFRSISMVLRMPGAEEKLIEKLSIILQKLSKLRANKKYFEVFGITTTAQEMLRSMCVDNAFLALNLKSILFNLNFKSHQTAVPSVSAAASMS